MFNNTSNEKNHYISHNKSNATPGPAIPIRNEYRVT